MMHHHRAAPVQGVVQVTPCFYWIFQLCTRNFWYLSHTRLLCTFRKADMGLHL